MLQLILRREQLPLEHSEIIRLLHVSKQTNFFQKAEGNYRQIWDIMSNCLRSREYQTEVNLEDVHQSLLIIYETPEL